MPDHPLPIRVSNLSLYTFASTQQNAAQPSSALLPYDPLGFVAPISAICGGW